MENDTPATAVSLEDLRGHDEGATREKAVSELIVTPPRASEKVVFAQPQLAISFRNARQRFATAKDDCLIYAFTRYPRRMPRLPPPRWGDQRSCVAIPHRISAIARTV